MSSTVRKPMTVEEFLAWEDKQPLRWEFDGSAPVARNSGTQEHSIIQGNLIFALHSRLRGSGCRVYGSDFKIEVDGSIRYPDAFVLRSRLPVTATVTDQPVVVFEILSPSTSRIDRIVKAREYGSTPSIVRYVILEPNAVAATVFTRTTGVWAGIVVVGAVELDMPEIGISLPLAELYTDVEIEPDDEAAA